MIEALSLQALRPPTPGQTYEAPPHHDIPHPSSQCSQHPNTAGTAWPFAPDVNMKVFAVELPSGEPVDFSRMMTGEFMDRFPMSMYKVRDPLVRARVQTEMNRIVDNQSAMLFTVDDNGALVMAPPRAGGPEVPLYPPMVFMRDAGGTHKALVVMEDEDPYGGCNVMSGTTVAGIGLPHTWPDPNSCL